VEANIPEILREAGSQVRISVMKSSSYTYNLLPQGLHVKDIGKKCGSDSHKMGECGIESLDFLMTSDLSEGRVLRYLATNHIFREVSPDVFANNRISSALDTGKSVSTIKEE
jgi:hypothetical protein